MVIIRKIILNLIIRITFSALLICSICIWGILGVYLIQREDFYTQHDIELSALHEAGHCLVSEYNFPGSVESVSVSNKPSLRAYNANMYGQIKYKTKEFIATKIKGEEYKTNNVTEGVKVVTGVTMQNEDKIEKSKYIEKMEVYKAGAMSQMLLAEDVTDRLQGEAGAGSDKRKEKECLKEMLLDRGLIDSLDVKLEKLDINSDAVMIADDTEDKVYKVTFKLVDDNRERIKKLAKAITDNKDNKLTGDEVRSILDIGEKH